MLYLEAEIGTLGALNAEAPAYGTIVSGIQEMNPSVADDVLTVLASRFLAPSPVPAQGEGVFNFIAVTAARLAELGLSTSEATKSATDYIRSLPAGNYALVDANDVAAIEQNPKTEADIHVTVANAAAVPYIAGPGSNLVVMSPLTTAVTETPKKSMVKPLVGAVIGGVGGALVGGGIGAAVGAVGGFIVGNAVT